MNQRVTQPEEEVALYSGGTAAVTSVSSVRWQQRDLTVAGV